MKNKKKILMIVAILIAFVVLGTAVVLERKNINENKTMNIVTATDKSVGEATKETKIYFKANKEDKVLTTISSGTKFSILADDKEYTDSNNNVYYLVSYKEENGKNYIGYILKEDVKKKATKETLEKEVTLYFKANKNDKVLTTIPVGGEILYLSRTVEYKDTDNNEYYLVSYKEENGKNYIGYVLKEDVEPKEEITPEPTPEPDPTPEPEPTPEPDPTPEPEPTKVEPTSITLNKTTATIEVGSTVTLTATIAPSDATDKTVTWSSSNTNIATVSNGVVTAKATGTVTITARTSNGKTATANITINRLATSITLTPGSYSVKKGDIINLTATVLPADTTDKTVIWSSSNTNIATVSNGKVTTKSAGTVTITAQTSNGKKATSTISVLEVATGINITSVKPLIHIGEKVGVSAAVTPSNAVDKTITWSSSNTAVASIDKNTGLITAKAKGNATITAKTSNGITNSIVITVHDINKIHYISHGDEYSISAAKKTEDGTGASPANTILLESNGHYALIDTGLANSNDLNKYHAIYVVNYLKYHKISKLDFILITHVHYDHLGGLTAILNKVKTGKVYMKPYYSNDGKGDGSIGNRNRFANVINNIYDKKLCPNIDCEYNSNFGATNYINNVKGDYGKPGENKPQFVKINADWEGKSINLSDNASITLYNTTNLSYHNNCKGTKNIEFDENSNSIVSYIRMGTKSALVAGDLEPVAKKGCYDEAAAVKELSNDFFANKEYIVCSAKKGADCSKEYGYSLLTPILQKIAPDSKGSKSIKKINLSFYEISHHGYSSCDMNNYIKNKLNANTLLVSNWYTQVENYYYTESGPYKDRISCRDHYYKGTTYDNKFKYVGTNNLIFNFTDGVETIETIQRNSIKKDAYA